MSEIPSQNLKISAIKGMVWKFLENIGTQMMQLAIQIVLARLLLPEEYGLVGLLTIFITISDVIIMQGLTTALIQKKDADEVDFSSVFYANLIVSIGLYIILYFSSPLIAEFYHEPALKGIMRVLCLNVIIGAVPAVHNAILSRNLEFKKSFYRNISNIVTQGIVGIFLAYMGLGVWSLVFSKISGMLVGTTVLCTTVKWRPKKYFDLSRIKSLFSYGSKILGTNLLSTVFDNIHSLVIGRYFTAADLGYYQRGQQIPQLSMGAVDGSLSAVLYPTFSKLQNDVTALKNALRRSIRTSMFFVLPILFGLFAVSEPLTVFLLTEKWLPSVPYMQLACFVCMFWPLSHRRHALNALGKSGLTFKISLVGRSITLVAIFICLRWGIYSIMIGTIISSAINMWITTWFVKKHIGYKMRELAQDVVPSLLLSAFMASIVMGIGLLNIPLFAKLVLQVLTGVIIYAGGAKIFRFESMTYVLNILFKKN